MKIRLSISKSIIIDTDDPEELSLGAGWKEQVLEALRDENPEAQIETADVDTLTGAVISCIDADVNMALDDFEITNTDFKVEILDEQGNPK